MALPLGVSACVVTFGPYMDQAGRPLQGSVTIVPSSDVTFNGTPLLRGPIPTKLVNGAGSVTLPHTDQEGMTAGSNSVINWTYRAVIRFKTEIPGEQDIRPFSFSLPQELGDTWDLDTAVPLEGVPGELIPTLVTAAQLEAALTPVQASASSALASANAVANALPTKVDKITGKVLSDNNYSTPDKSKLAGIADGATVNAPDAQLRDRGTHTGTQAISTVSGLQALLDTKVVAISGKGLSTNDYTNTDKSAVDALPANLNTKVAKGSLRINVADYASAVAAVAAAPAGSTVYFPPGVYVNPSGLGNGITVPADNITLELAAGAEIQVQTWGQPGIDCIGRSGIKVLGGVVRYTGTRGNHLGNSGRQSALYNMGAGVWINKDRCLVQGLRTINMPVGVFLSSYNGVSATDYRGTGNKVKDIEVQGANWGVLWTAQQALTIDGMYFHDDVDDSSGANPTHAIYCSSSDTYRSCGVTISNLITENCLFGQPYQVKYADNIVMTNLVARNSRGLANVIGCVDLSLSGATATGSLASLSAPFGAITVQGAGAKRHRYTNIAIEVDQVGGVDQRSVLVYADDSTIDGLTVVSKRTSSGTAGQAIVEFRGVNPVIRNLNITETSAFAPVAVAFGTSSVTTTGVLVDGVRIAGCLRGFDLYDVSGGVIRYAAAMVGLTSSLTSIRSGSPSFTVYEAGLNQLTFNVCDYGALGTWTGTTGSDDTVAINAAIAARNAAGGGEIFFPPRPSGQGYRYLGTLPTTSGITYRGTDRERTKISITGFDAFGVPSGTSKAVIISGLYFSITSGHFLNVADGAHCYFWRVRDCVIALNSNNKSFVYSRGMTNYLENYWENLDLYRPGTSTVPGFDIINSLGGANCNVWKRIRANSANCTAAPFWRLESDTTGQYTWDNTWEDIVGEQNPGGLIHLYSAQGCHIRSTYDYDASVTYTDHVIKIDKSATSTTESRSIALANAGRRGGTLGSGIQDCYVSPNARTISLVNVGNHTATPVLTLSTKGAYYNDAAGLRMASGDIVQTGRNTTANRPSASTAGVGSVFFDTTLNKPVWSDGTNWVESSADKAPLAGATFTGAVTVPTPTVSGHATTKAYVDTAISGVSAGTPTDVQGFSSSGTWTKPSGAKMVEVLCIGPGAGGGSGRRGASGTVCGGGGGGAGGVVVRAMFDAADLGSTETVTIPTGGAGGAAVTTDNTNGNIGSQGSGNTIFGTSSPKRVIAPSGFSTSPGGGGTTSGGAAGVSPYTLSSNSSMSGGAAGGAGAAGVAVNPAVLGPAGGPGGGGISATPAAFNGGSGAYSCMGAGAGGSAGVVDTTAPTSGTAPTQKGAPGQSGGGGASSITTAAQDGADATGYGAGGAGGGASLNGNNSGKGGAGGGGYCLVITHF